MLAMIFGAIGIAMNCNIYRQKDGKKLLLSKMMSDLLWFIHYMLLHAYSASAVAFIGIIREMFFYKESKKEHKNIFILLFFVFITILFALFTWKNITSIFPAIASILSIVGFWKANPAFSRLLVFPISTFMLLYDVTCNSYVGIINEILTVVTTILSIILFAKRKNKNVYNN